VPVRFGDFVLDLTSRQMRRAGTEVRLPPKAFDLLALLVGERPRAVPKAEILEKVWPDVVVTESSLARLASDIRSALGDTAREPRFVRTVFGFGYAFCGEVIEEAARPEASPWRLQLGDREILLDEGDNLVGRGDDVPVGLDGSSVSRRHARISVRGDRVEVEDLGSKNGTFVMGRRIAGPTPLAEGETLCIGSVLLVCARAPRGSTSTDTGAPRGPE
jgi:DNA-binding winged helix-turn-helix (wHTH) protein